MGMKTPDDLARVLSNSPKLLLFGCSFGTTNRGVSALAHAVTKLLREETGADVVAAFPIRPSAADIAWVQRFGALGASTSPYRLSPLSPVVTSGLWAIAFAAIYRVVPWSPLRIALCRSNTLLGETVSADVIADIWGGDSFSDIYGRTRMLKRSIGSILAVILRKKLVLLPQTYGPYRTEFGRALGRLVAGRAAVAMARTRDTSWLNSLGLHGQLQPVFCPDVAFTLPSSTSATQSGALFDDARPIVGVNVSGLLYDGGYTGDNMFGLAIDYRVFVHRLVLMFLSNFRVNVLLIPHTYDVEGDGKENDYRAAQTLATTLVHQDRRRLHVVSKNLDETEIKGVIGECAFFVGSRLHSCIAALSHGLPTIAVAYSHKFRDVFGSIGLSDLVVDGRIVDSEAALERIQVAFVRRDEVAGRVRAAVEETASSIRQSFSRILKDTSLDVYSSSNG